MKATLKNYGSRITVTIETKKVISPHDFRKLCLDMMPKDFIISKIENNENNENEHKKRKI